MQNHTLPTISIKIKNIFNDFIYLILERGEGREKERERNIIVWLPLICPLLGTWPATQPCALTGNLTANPLVHSLSYNPLSHTSQGKNKTKQNRTKQKNTFLTFVWTLLTSHTKENTFLPFTVSLQQFTFMSHTY